ncbi:MAG: hypothetical protein VX670_11675, partial [Candidatus Latescibacterota bacterium]|nr:hypothetical protein [Candidatus Latescibacterota bacterium]
MIRTKAEAEAEAEQVGNAAALEGVQADEQTAAEETKPAETTKEEEASDNKPAEADAKPDKAPGDTGLISAFAKGPLGPLKDQAHLEAVVNA